MDLDAKLSETVTQSKHVRGRGRLFVMQHLDAIRQALTQGHVQKDIWQTLHDAGQMPISYRQFNKHIEKLMAPPPAGGDAKAAAIPAATAPVIPAADAAPSAPPPPHSQRQAAAKAPPAFNPIPNMEDLI